MWQANLVLGGTYALLWLDVPRSEAQKAAVHTPVYNYRDFVGISDDQLYQIFHNGSSTIPGFDKKNEFQFCVGEPLINAWTQGGAINDRFHLPCVFWHNEATVLKQNFKICPGKQNG